MASTSWTQIVTPDQACEWLENYLYEKQRPLRKRHVAKLAEKMKEGTFIQDTEIKFLVFDGKSHLVNGQHRLAAIVNSNLPQSLIVIETESTAEEAPHIYSSLDIGMRRTPSDKLRAYSIAEELDLNQTHANKFWAVATFMLNGCFEQGQKGMDETDVIPVMRLYNDQFQEYIQLIEGAPAHNAGIRRSITIAVAVLGMRFTKDKDKVREFWKGAANDSGLLDKDPAKVAFRHLSTTNVISGRVHVKGIVHPAMSVRILGECFNRYMKGKPLSYLPRDIDASLPLDLFEVPSFQSGEWFR